MFGEKKERICPFLKLCCGNKGYLAGSPAQSLTKVSPLLLVQSDCTVEGNIGPISSCGFSPLLLSTNALLNTSRGLLEFSVFLLI